MKNIGRSCAEKSTEPAPRIIKERIRDEMDSLNFNNGADVLPG